MTPTGILSDDGGKEDIHLNKRTKGRDRMWLTIKKGSQKQIRKN
jgi:hypothetical protein